MGAATFPALIRGGQARAGKAGKSHLSLLHPARLILNIELEESKQTYVSTALNEDMRTHRVTHASRGQCDNVRGVGHDGVWSWQVISG